MHTPDTAVAAILRHIEPLPSVSIPVAEALGRVLGTDVVSTIDLPHWDNSAMDGFAARSDDLPADAPLELDIIEEIPAGAFPQRRIEPGQCARIFTGAPIPDGADCVIRQEDTTLLDGNRVRIDDRRDVGRNVRPRGEDVRAGDTVLCRHSEIGPAQLGVLVSLAQRTVTVFRQPRVAILASGDEIADLDQADAIRRGRKVASSNTYTLTALVQRAGGVPLDLGIARDDPDDLTTRLEAGRDADLILTSAGVSVGEHDYLHLVLDRLQVRDKFWRIRMRPGAPVGFGRIGAFGNVPWIGLPGNPVSTMVTFELFVRPAIRVMAGHRLPFRRTIPVRVAEDITLGPPLRHYLRVTLEDDGARLTGPQGSGLLTSMAKADALLIVPEDKPTVRAGETLDALVLDDPKHRSEV